MTLLQELKQRKVIRTTLAYLAAAFIAAQAVQLISDALGLPQWILKAVVITLVVLLPLVIGLAWAFDITPEGVEHTTSQKTKVQWKRIGIPAVASGMTLFIALTFITLGKTDPSLNMNVVAVMPFHVSGDPQLGYLREGIIDLMAAKLTGEGGPRAADPRAVMAAVRKHGGDDPDQTTAREIARSLGAGQTLIGSIVGTGQNFKINAQLVRLNGSPLTAEINGSSDSLFVTIDRLVAKLLTLQAGEGNRLDQLTTTSLPALRAYLDGQAAYRHGFFGRATALFASAVDTDSTFATAAIGYVLASGWGEGAGDGGKAMRTLEQHQDKLGIVDRQFAQVLLMPSKGASFEQRQQARERLLAMAPENADAWFYHADVLSHWGTVIDVPPSTAERAFHRVLQIDSTYLPAVIHLMDLAQIRQDPATYRRLEVLRKRLDPYDSAAVYQRSMRYRELGDTAALAAMRANMDALPSIELEVFALTPSLGATDAQDVVDDALHALDGLGRRATTKSERADYLATLAERYSTFGMPSRAAVAFDEGAALMDDPLPRRAWQLLTVLYQDGDPVAGARVVKEMPALIANTTNERSRLYGTCALAQWRLWHNDMSQYDATSLSMARTPADNPVLKSEADMCVQTLATIRALQKRSPDLKSRVAALNAVMRTGPAGSHTLRNASNIVLSKAAEATGDRALAFRAIQRHPWHPAGLALGSSMYRDDARLAAANGDRRRAIQFYLMYLNTRTHAEPALKQTDDAVRRELARLTGESK